MPYPDEDNVPGFLSAVQTEVIRDQVEAARRNLGLQGQEVHFTLKVVKGGPVVSDVHRAEGCEKCSV